jgi:nitrite reductase (NADH) small subunit
MAWIRIAASDQLADNSALEVLVQGEVVAVFRTKNNLFAIDGICAHQGGPLSRGKVSEDCVTCPWHGWRYKLASGDNATTDKPMLKPYPIRETDGQIELLVAD